jgi:hypothetical protein
LVGHPDARRLILTSHRSNCNFGRYAHLDDRRSTARFPALICRDLPESDFFGIAQHNGISGQQSCLIWRLQERYCVACASLGAFHRRVRRRRQPGWNPRGPSSARALDVRCRWSPSGNDCLRRGLAVFSGRYGRCTACQTRSSRGSRDGAAHRIDSFASGFWIAGFANGPRAEQPTSVVPLVSASISRAALGQHRQGFSSFPVRIILGHAFIVEDHGFPASR